jgi:hypothetical protein
MTIRLIVDGVGVPIKTVNFSDGSSNVQLLVPDQLKKYPPSAYVGDCVSSGCSLQNLRMF